MFSDINIDRWVGIVGLVAALVSIWLAYHFYRKSVRAKVLAIAYTAPIPLMLPVQDVSVFYMGTNHDALSRVFVLLWNRGTAPIEATDFVAPISIRSTDAVLQVRIFDKDATATADVHAEEDDVYIDLLRPNEAIVLQIDAAEEAYKPDISVVMKSPDMSTVLEGPVAMGPSILGWIVGLGALPAYLYLNPDPLPIIRVIPEWLEPAVAVLSSMLPIGLAAATGRIVYSVKRSIMRHSFSPVATSFFDMQLRAINALEEGRKLNKKISEINQKSPT